MAIWHRFCHKLAIYNNLISTIKLAFLPHAHLVPLLLTVKQQLQNIFRGWISPILAVCFIKNYNSCQFSFFLIGLQNVRWVTSDNTSVFYHLFGSWAASTDDLVPLSHSEESQEIPSPSSQDNTLKESLKTTSLILIAILARTSFNIGNWDAFMGRFFIFSMDEFFPTDSSPSDLFSTLFHWLHVEIYWPIL